MGRSEGSPSVNPSAQQQNMGKMTRHQKIALTRWICLAGISALLLWRFVASQGVESVGVQPPRSLVSESPEPAAPQALSDAEIEAIARQVVVQVRASESKFVGSGFLVRQEKNTGTYWVLTNDHVLRAGDAPYQVQTLDGTLHDATERQIDIEDKTFFGELNDLAILEFKSANQEYKIAEIQPVTRSSDSPPPREDDPVYAAGFPFVLQSGNSSFVTNGDRDATECLQDRDEGLPGFVFCEGQLFRVLDDALQGGYQVGYSNEIQKGMSGGPLFDRFGRAIAVNGMHAYPLWGDPYIYRDGSSPETGLHEAMFEYSWGIPIDRYLEAIESYALRDRLPTARETPTERSSQ